MKKSKIYVDKKRMFKITIFDLYMRMILILPITTLFQTALEFINRSIFVFIIVLQIVIIGRKLNKFYMVFFSFAIVGYIIALLNTTNLSYDNSMIYYINWILYAGTMVMNKEQFIRWIQHNRKYIHFIMIAWTLIVFVSIPFSTSWYIKEGGKKYFGSLTGTIFRLGPTALFIQILSLVSMAIYQEKKSFKYMILPLFCGFMGSSRTYLILICLVFFIGLYMRIRNKKIFFSATCFSILLLLFLYQFSAMSYKVALTLDDTEYGDFWYRITSSRTWLWSVVLRGFKQFDQFHMLFGGGINSSILLTNNVYSHNDFIEILITYGISGVIIYVLSISLLLKKFFKNRNKKYKWCLMGLCVFVWFFNAMFNMFYYYTCAALSFPFLLAAVSCRKEEL